MRQVCVGAMWITSAGGRSLLWTWMRCSARRLRPGSEPTRAA